VEHQHAGAMSHSSGGHYRKFALMIGLSFVAMYLLMYAMINSVNNFFNNVNQFYMAGLMVAAMLIIELVVMFAMYPNKRLNGILIVAGFVLLGVFWVFTRRQVGVGDKQFLRSMIPHHAGAILMCNQAPLKDAEIRQLCQGILASQQHEIDQMKAILRRLGS